MHVLIAPDSFKGSMSSVVAGECMERGVRSAFPGAAVERVALADGGEGTVDALLSSLGGEKGYCEVTGPMGGTVKAGYGILPDGRIVMETAAASGLTLVKAPDRNPWKATSRGTGELLRHVLDHEPTEIIVGLGGSATVDGGIGFLQALGVRLLDSEGREVPAGGQALERVARIDLSSLDPRLQRVRVIAAADVDNPLLGETGAVPVFAPQKGAGPGMLNRLEAGMRHYAGVVADTVQREIGHLPGGGAAGGLGMVLLTFCGARLESGFSLIARMIGLEEKMARSDVVLTGEGRLDSQSLHGKTTVGVARMARRHQIPVLVFAGALGSDLQRLEQEGITAAYTLVSGPMSVEEAEERGKELLEQAVFRFFRGISVLCGGNRSKAGVRSQ